MPPVYGMSSDRAKCTHVMISRHQAGVPRVPADIEERNVIKALLPLKRLGRNFSNLWPGPSRHKGTLVVVDCDLGQLPSL